MDVLTPTALAHERPRLVRLCAQLTGSSADAEDLAQDTLMEAWRHRDRLYDPSGAASWLSAIARNVCLRWRRRAGQEAASRRIESIALADLELQLGDGVDLEVELERRELAELLDRAMDHLPAGTRDVLLQRLVADLPVAEVAARNRTSEGAVWLRLHRGRRALHRLLTTSLREEAEDFGLFGDQVDQWEATRVWCPLCGDGRLRVRWEPHKNTFIARCPSCRSQTVDQAAPFLQGVKGPWRMVTTVNREAHRYFRDAIQRGEAPCCCCGRLNPIAIQWPQIQDGVVISSGRVSAPCDACEAISEQPSVGLALTLPEVQQFWRAHRRIRTLPERPLEYRGAPALLRRFESVPDGEAVNVISHARTFDVLDIHHESSKTWRSV